LSFRGEVCGIQRGLELVRLDLVRVELRRVYTPVIKQRPKRADVATALPQEAVGRASRSWSGERTRTPARLQTRCTIRQSDCSLDVNT
jgi:hypothetical protein